MLPSGELLLQIGAVLWPIAVAIDIIVRFVMIGIVPGNRRPTTAMAWLLAIYFIPVAGLAAYLLFANPRLSRRRLEKQRRANESITDATAHMQLPEEFHSTEEWVESAVVLNRKLGAFPLDGGNKIEVLSNYKASLESMRQAIEQAQRYVHIQFYIMGDDEEYVGPVLDALEAASRRGVNVRLLFDHLGTLRVTGYRDLKKRLRKSDIEWRAMLPIDPIGRRWRRPDLRNHRKILVVDGAVAFTGSQNLIEPGYKRESSHALGREWVEMMLRVEGPLVRSLDVTFATDWWQEDDTTDVLSDLTEASHPLSQADQPGATLAQVLPSGPGYESENNLRLFNTLMYSATERLKITSPYFVPDDSLLYAITTAAQRGVEVELFVCEKGDQFLVHHAQQSYYQQLLQAGVRIYRYPAPKVLHTKCFTADSDVAVVGSSNMDMRSFSLNMEISVMMLGPEIVDAVNQVQDHYREISSELTLSEWRRRPRLQRWIDNVCRLTATLQ
ncbi:cardiolipin synthase [Glutamicibacter sp. 287]|uniref:cardiolipin synthase n=1 Tax=unclassified Glutamicibacter TaxID=2627139 RepID=UPI000BB6CF99|nr:cardiolipin synthase [Glutamicibacter sp. BW80]PCC30066.1 cardiolipin synthase [Glutamicibacter sp. BW80]